MKQINQSKHKTDMIQSAVSPERGKDVKLKERPVQNKNPSLAGLIRQLTKRYLFVLIMLFLFAVLFVVDLPTGVQAVNMTWKNILEMLAVIPPIFVLLGLLDVWVPRETMIRFTGESSGFLGMLISFLLGSFAAGPLYAAFPVAALMLKKGSKLSNVFILIGAWSTTKIPLLLFEASAMGLSFMLLRFALNIPVILLIAWLSEKILSKHDREVIYNTAEETA